MIKITNPGAETPYACGLCHPAGERTYPDDWFTAAQLKELNAHPTLTAQRVTKPKAPAKKVAKKKVAKKRVTKKASPRQTQATQ